MATVNGDVPEIVADSMLPLWSRARLADGQTIYSLQANWTWTVKRDSGLSYPLWLMSRDGKHWGTSRSLKRAMSLIEAHERAAL